MIAVGVDTHKHEHVARALDHLGQVLGELTVPASLDGYRAFVDWLGELGGPLQVGIEGAGSYGAGLCEFLLINDIDVVEVQRPRRQDRRQGKSDDIDALLAARKVLAGEGLARPRAGGNRRALAALLLVYRSTVAERVRVVNQLQALHTTAPLTLRERIGPGNGAALTARLRKMHARTQDTAPERLIFDLLRELAGRAHALGELAARYRAQLAELTTALAPRLLAQPGVGPVSAAQLLICDARRFRNEAPFARCNGTAPKPASSVLTTRHRLDRGGDRQANCALHTIALSRALHDPETRAYIERRKREGKTRREASRALKRHLSRQLYKTLITIPLTS